jgi:hypothetical protein
MTDYRIEVEIEASPGQVWSVMRDVEHWREWTPTVTSVRLLDRRPLHSGSRALIRQPKLPPVVWKVTELDDAARSFTWVSAAPGLRVIARHWVEPSVRGSRASLSLRFTGLFGGLLARLTGGLNDRYLAVEAKGLKQRSERGRIPQPAC